MRAYKQMFQHRHYAAIAKVLADLQASQNEIGHFASLFQQDNPRFDRDRFFHAAMGMPINGKDAR